MFLSLKRIHFGIVVFVFFSHILTLVFLFYVEDFHLSIDGGDFTDSEIIVMLGENGKSTCS